MNSRNNINLVEDYMKGINLDAVKKYAASRFKLGSGSVHGMSHWQKVEQNGLMLAAVDPNVNKKVVRLFAYLHDCERQDDYDDSEHGERAAEKLYDIADTLLAALDEDEFEQLHTAIELHNSEWCTGDSTVDACFDADRLDLTRLGITLDPDYMATETGRKIALNQLN